MYICIFVYMHIHVYICKHIHIYIFTDGINIHMYIELEICTYVIFYFSSLFLKHHFRVTSVRFWRLTFDGDQASRPGFGWHQDVPVTWRDALGIS